jgi:hypothetical protein
MASQFVTTEEVMGWLYEYSNGTEEDGEVYQNIDFLTSFADGYIADAVGDWILTSTEERVLKKVRLLIQAIVSDLYSSRSLTDEQATHRSARVRYLYQSTFNQLSVMQPPLVDESTPTVNIWNYL